jgi:hypothetical protein
MKTRSDELITAKVLTFVRGNNVITAELKKSDVGWCAEWLISANLESSITIVGNVILPIHGELESEVIRRAEFMVDDVLAFVQKNVGGSGKVSRGPQKTSMAEVGLAHVVAHRGIFKLDSITNQTTAEYVFLVDQIGLKNNPAVLLAGLDGIKISTLKRRIGRGIYGY